MTTTKNPVLRKSGIIALSLALCCAASSVYATANDAFFIADADVAVAKVRSNEPQQKIVYLEANLSDCLLGDECPEPKLEEGELRQRQILPLLLSQGWRVVSVTPVRASRVGMNSVVSEVSFAYVLLQKP